jgi:uncharacterized membrane-anchored protein
VPAPATLPTTTGPAGRSGQFALPASDVSLTVPTSFLFYPADAARAHLARIGAPLPNGDVLGMIAPADRTPGQDNFWGAIVTYQQIGRVDAATATGLAESGFPQTVRQARNSAQRGFEGFESPPAFAAGSNSVSWIEQTARPQPTATAYRAETRVLGRRGVAGLTVPVRQDQLSEAKAMVPTMLGMVGFTQSNGYGDFNAQVDQPSAYSVPGLVTNMPSNGAVAQTAGIDGPGMGAGKSGPAGTNYLPWLVGGAAVVGLLAWLALGNRRREDDEDPNIRPRDE